MKLTTILLAVISLSSLPILSSETTSTEPLLCVVGDYKSSHGYINIKGGLVIPQKLYTARNFVNGFAMVKQNKESGWSFIDKKGQIITKESYYRLYDFSEGLACFKRKDEKTKKVTSGVIDEKGNMVIKEGLFTRVYPFQNGFAKVLIDTNGKRETGIIDKAGTFKLKLKDGEGVGAFYEELAIFYQTEGKKKVYGFMDSSFNVVIKPQYAQVGNFSEGKAWVRDENAGWFINKNGKTVISPNPHLTLTSYFNDDRYVDTDKTRFQYGFRGKNGEWIIKPLYRKARNFSDGLALVQNQKKMWGFINKNGGVAIPFNLISAGSFKNGYAMVRTDKENQVYYFIDTKGKTVLRLKYPSSNLYFFN